MLLHPEGVGKPGASTPGTVPERRALQGRQIKRRHNTGQTCTHLSPFRANHLFGWFPGLKPWAESFSPFGAKTIPDSSPCEYLRFSGELLQNIVPQEPVPKRFGGFSHRFEISGARRNPFHPFSTRRRTL